MAKTASQLAKSNRNKGHRFENLCAKELFNELGIEFKRNLNQVREAHQGDLISCDPDFPFIIECKRRKSGNRLPSKAWDQVVSSVKAMQDKGVTLYPSVLYRRAGQPTVATVSYSSIVEGETGTKTQNVHDQADLTFEAFCKLSREIMAWRNV